MATITLRIEYPNREPENRRLVGERFSIGRDNGDIALHESLVSSSHAELVIDESQRVLIFTDLGSSNGSYRPTGERLTEPTPLTQGGSLYIGGCTITVTAIEFETPPPSAPPPRGGTFVGEAEALARTPSGTIITDHKAGEAPAPQQAAYQQPGSSHNPYAAAQHVQAPSQAQVQTPEARYQAPQAQVHAPQPQAHAPQAQVHAPQAQVPEAQHLSQAPSHQQAPVATPQTHQAPVATPQTRQAPVPMPVAQPSVDTSNRSGQWLEVDAGPGDPHQQTFVMSLSSGYVLVRTRTQGQAGPIETTVAAPGTLADFRLR